MRGAVKLFELSCSLNTGLTYNISDTRGLKNDMVVLMFDGTNYERATIASFVVSTSFTIKKALTVATGTIESVKFHGFHTMIVEAGTTGFFMYSAFEYEPLDITPSNALKRSVETESETVSVTFRDVPNLGDIYYPYHSDGINGNWSTSSIEVIGTSAASTYGFDQDLKNIQVGAGTIDVKITSTRNVPKRGL